MAASKEFAETERKLMLAARNRSGQSGNQAVTLGMIETAPSYEARANLIRTFVRQDPERAALVVRQMLGADANG